MTNENIDRARLIQTLTERLPSMDQSDLLGMGSKLSKSTLESLKNRTNTFTDTIQSTIGKVGEVVPDAFYRYLGRPAPSGNDQTTEEREKRHQEFVEHVAVATSQQPFSIDLYSPYETLMNLVVAGGEGTVELLEGFFEGCSTDLLGDLVSACTGGIIESS